MQKIQLFSVVHNFFLAMNLITITSAKRNKCMEISKKRQGAEGTWVKKVEIIKETESLIMVKQNIGLL